MLGWTTWLKTRPLKIDDPPGAGSKAMNNGMGKRTAETETQRERWPTLSWIKTCRACR
jgi:hypothetical protein